MSGILAALGLVELAAIGTFATAIVGVLAALRLLPGQKGELRITREQGAATLRDSFISSLQRDLERKNEELERLDGLLREMREENDGLRRRAGTRKGDADEPPPATRPR